MGQVITNLKARFGADTSDLKKGLKDGEKAVDDFKGAAGNAVEKLAEIFGVNMSAINGALDTAKKELNFLGQSFNAAAKGGKVLTLAMNVLKVALISTGIGALIVALGSLISYFKGTGEGADKFRVIMAQLRSVIDNLVDRLQSFGAGLVDIFSGRFRDGVEKIRGAFKGMGEEIKEDWRLAKDLADRENELYRMETQLITSLEERRQKVEELRLAARDLTATDQEQLAAQKQAIEIRKSIMNDELAVERERLAIMEEKLRISASDPTREQLREIAEQQAKLNSIQAAGARGLLELTEYYNTLQRKINAAAEAQEKLNQKAEEAWQTMLKTSVGPSTPLLDLSKIQGQLAEVKGAVVESMSALDEELTKAIEGSLEMLASGIGEMLGNLMTGRAGFQDFGLVVAQALADMAITVGKIAIATGIAVSGIKAALESLNPALAIAAGIALVAIGSAVKGALSNVASGASASSSGAYSGQGYSFDTRIPSTKAQPVTVAVSGELRLRGKDLYAAIEEEEKDRYSNT